MAKEGTFRTNAPFAAVLFLFLGTFHPPGPTDGRPDTSRGRHATAGTRGTGSRTIHALARAPRDRGDTTRQLPSDPRVQAQASSLLKSAPVGPRSPPAGQDLHRPGPLDAGSAQIPMSPRLDPQTGRISRSRRRRPDPSTLPGHSIPFRLFEAAQPPQTGVAGSPQDRHARRNDDGNDAEQNEGGEKTQTQRKNKLGAQPRR